MPSSLLDINAKVERLFKNPNINFFIIMNLVLIITCYTLLNNDTHISIRYILSKPIVIIISICIIILIGYFNLNIAILSIVLLFIMLFTTSSFTNTSNPISNLNNAYNNSYTDSNTDSNTENFTNSSDDKLAKQEHIEKTKAIIEKQQNEHRTQYKADKRAKLEEKVSNFANIFTKNIKSLNETNENQLKNGLIENKQKLLEKLESENKTRNSINGHSSSFDNVKTNTTGKGLKASKGSKGSKGSSEQFQSIEIRKFNPTSEDDTNLLITKEILQDMMNRITYNYESTTYLKKYLKHRLEEIIDTNNLLKDDDE